MYRITAATKWLIHKAFESFPAVLTFLILSQLLGFALWVVSLDKRMTILEARVAEMTDREDRIVQALDSVYHELTEYVRGQKR